MARLWDVAAAAVNLRTLILAIAVGLLLLPWQPLSLGNKGLNPEQSLFSFGTTLITPPATHLSITTVTLDTDVIDQLVQGPKLSNDKAPNWMAKLLPLLTAQGTTVGLILPAAPSWQHDDPLYQALGATLTPVKHKS